MAIAFDRIENAWAYFSWALGAIAHEQYPEVVRETDAGLAAFVRANPGVLEARLFAGLAELAAVPLPNRGAPSSLGALLCLDAEACPLRETFAALEPFAALTAVVHALRGHRKALGEMGLERGFLLARHFMKPLGPDVFDRPDVFVRAGAAPEMVDAWYRRPPLPDILPLDIGGMTPDDIAAAFEAYMGMPIAELEAHLRPGGSSESGFLAEGERLGQVIFDDARKLAELGVNRHAIADRIKELIARRRAGEEDSLVEVSVEHHLGYQSDPFHRNGRSETNIGNCVFTLRNTKNGATIRGGGPVIALIRRACFFEGSVPYRVDPETAARVLGFLA